MTFSSQVSRYDPHLGYMPAIPEPFWLGGIWPWKPKMQCHCGSKFKTRPEYDAHYVLNHIES